MTQKEVHNAIVLNTTQEQKTELALACAVYGVKIQDIEETVAKTVTAISKVIRQQDIEYLNQIMI